MIELLTTLWFVWVIMIIAYVVFPFVVMSRLKRINNEVVTTNELLTEIKVALQRKDGKDE